MKNKKFSILLIVLLSASFTIAQEQSKISFAILGGVNFQNLNGIAYSGDKLNNDMLLGYHAGVNVQIAIAPEFYFQPGLMYATKGAKNTIISDKSSTTLNYIELPLNMVYKAALGNGFVMLGFGPYVAYGISGKMKDAIGNIGVTKNVMFQNSVDNPLELAYSYKAFDAGANIFFGYEMASGIFLQLESQFGMLNINPEGSTNDKSITNNTGFGLSLGYRF
ncbi:MAG: PorT family protein [Paludibacter sp.]|nr:PorT family protein [Paludibacter sp.]